MYYFLGTSLYGKENYKEAKKSFESAKDIFKNHQEYAELYDELINQIENCKDKMEQRGEVDSDDETKGSRSESHSGSLILPIAIASAAAIGVVAYFVLKN
jgi:sulfur relay (sulfurtransferase) complex TusBCD TusD component (DsrE family)